MRAGSVAVTPDDVVWAPLGPIAFQAPDCASQLPHLPHATPTVDSNQVTCRSQRLQADLPRLLAWANSKQLEPPA
jgi:hypothetical protein